MLKNVQALRAIAAMLVVFDHMNGVLANTDPHTRTFFDAFRYFGNFGVDLFFVISGFIMVATNWDAFARAGSSQTFILRRLARIYPPYWLVLLPILVAFMVAPHQFMHAHEGRADVLASILLLPQEYDPLLIVSWTLTFELFFYAIFAVLLRAKREALLPLLGVWAALQIVLALTLHGAANSYVGFLGTPLPLEFIMGAGIGYLFRLGTMPLARSLGAIGIVVSLVVWIASATPGATADLGMNGLSRVLQFGMPAALIVYGAVGWEGLVGSIAPSWGVALGDASYAIYLWHVPIGIVVGSLANRLHVHGIVADSIVHVVCLAVIIGVSLAAYNYFERPVTTYLNKWVAQYAASRTRSSLSEGSGVAIENG